MSRVSQIFFEVKGIEKSGLEVKDPDWMKKWNIIVLEGLRNC